MAERFIVQGWCPGARRPMPSGDGLVVRVRLSGGVLTLPQARALAELSASHGNGEIDLSARANLQLRGVSEATWPALITALEALGVLDDDAACEAVRNIMVAPLAGLDATATDVRPLAEALARRLHDDESLHALPGKFGYGVCGGGALPLEHLSDVGVRVWGERAILFAAGHPVGETDAGRAVDAMLALARHFLARRGEARRMGDVLRRDGADVLMLAAGLQPTAAARGPASALRTVIGAHRLGAAAYSGFALPFGRISADTLAALTDAAAAAGADEFRLTPWRALLAVGLVMEAATLFAEKAGRLGLIVDPDAPLLNVVACPGAPRCPQALADVRTLARTLAPLVPPALAPLHVSGCAKGCAHHARAPLTLTATPDGFDLIEDGLARDEPRLRALSPDLLAAMLKARYAALSGNSP